MNLIIRHATLTPLRYVRDGWAPYIIKSSKVLSQASLPSQLTTFYYAWLNKNKRLHKYIEMS